MSFRQILRTGLCLLALGGSLVALPRTSAAARCGATERWFVKVGTDPKAHDVDVAHPRSITVAELNQLPQERDQVPSGDDSFRLDDETKVYTVHGFLALFKNETDSDYHLVITDESLRFTPGGPGTDGQETGTSFIAEIPDPDCVAGKRGDPSVPSAFAAQLKACRDAFEQQFPQGKGADKEVNLPVTITGVAFYDRQHRQTGRAVNGMELHPLLDITFGGGAPQPPIPISTELLSNPGFEDGATGWTGAVESIGEYAHQAAHGGTQLCWLGGYGYQKTETVSQQVDLPSGAQKITLSFWISITTKESTTDAAYDQCKIQIKSPTGAILKTLVTFSNLNETAGFLKKSFDLTTFKGQRVRIALKASEDTAKQTSFLFDDFSVAPE